MITIPDGMRRPAEVERDELKKQLAEALETSAIRSRIVNKQTLELAGARAEIERKDALIEQMREALDEAHCALIVAHGCKLSIKRIEAALSAAERGE